MNSTESLDLVTSPGKPRASWLLWLLPAALVVIFCSLAVFYFMILSLDNSGIFFVTGDAADLDGDGDQDVVVHNRRQESEFTSFSGTLPWFNEGGGEFVAAGFEQGTEGGGWDSAAGDIDGDGDIDLLLFMGYELRLLLNQGGDQGGREGKFENSQLIQGPERNGQYGTILLGDLNGDGWLDGIIIGCCGRLFTVDPEDDAPNVSGVWLNNEGRLGEMAVLSALDGLAVPGGALGDVDGDGDLDLFAAVAAPSESRNRNPADRVMLNDGAGNFSDSGQQLGSVDSMAVVLGDVDGDGDLDALVGADKGAAWWINQGRTQGGEEGVFALLEQAIPGDQVRSVFLADFDGDSDLDALIGWQKLATIWWNDGPGEFTEDGQQLRISKRHGLIPGDFNGDGNLDIFAAEYDHNYRLWLNQGDGSFRRVSWP
ncbi:MAG: FG-GAP repeat domain-containing protein [Candidatus Promineifilaceae bacterium]|jgi:hypothetical protein